MEMMKAVRIHEFGGPEVLKLEEVPRPEPKTLDFVHAAAVPLAVLVAWQALLDTANLSAGQTVLIHGAAGGVGHYAIQIAKWKGANVIGTVLNSEDAEFIKKLGADGAIDVSQLRFEEVACEVDVVLDLIGKDTQERSWQVLRKGGVLVSSVGVEHPEEAENHGVRGVALAAKVDADELAEIAGLIDEGILKPTVQMVMPLEEAAKAHELLESQKARGKVVLKVAD